MISVMKRREFITLLGGAAAWPITARAQRAQKMRRIGVLMHLAADDPEGQRRVAAFLQGLQEAGLAVGRNVDIDVRWAGGEADRFPRYAVELIALGPDVILASATPSARAVRQATRMVPIVFVLVPDAVGSGLVDSLSRPGGNATGFTMYEFSIGTKWLELLKQVAPKVTRVAVFRDPANPAGMGQFGAIQGAAPSFGVEIIPIAADDAETIERGLTAFARTPNGGLIVVALPTTTMHRELIVKLAASHQLPAVYPSRVHAGEGGLVSFGSDTLNEYRSAAGYVDRILKGERAADLPVQAPTKYELVVNLKTAKALGLEMPASVLARADEVIE
jgi:putative tryptophan/tyrosine transport system substrate-binding protein